MKSDQMVSARTLNDVGKSLLAQRHQHRRIEAVSDKMSQGLDDLSKTNNKNLSELEALLAQTEAMLSQQNIDANTINYDGIDVSEVNELLVLTDEEKGKIKQYDFGSVDLITSADDITWEEYLLNIDKYAEKHDIDLSVDPFKELMSAEEYAEMRKRIEEDYTLKKAQCDKYDYIIAASSGVICGFIDAFFIGMPTKSKLGNWTDKTADNLVEKFTSFVYKADKKACEKAGEVFRQKTPDGIASCIGYLERRFKVNYDARYASDLGLTLGDLSMAPSNHHLKSLGHAPDLIGLFFSLLDQFKNTTSVISDGQIMIIENHGNFELRGKSFIAKLICGFSNWVGHIISDLAGSSGTRGHINHKRGSGVGIPFFQAFQLCDFGAFNVNGDKKTFAELSTRMFEKGYDARHGAAMAIPVVLNEMFIRILFAVKRKFYHKLTWKESMPFGNQPELRRMLVVGHGCLCLVDGIDAAARSGGNALTFALHMNIVAWSRFAISGLREIWVIVGKSTLDIEAMKKDLGDEWKKLSA